MTSKNSRRWSMYYRRILGSIKARLRTAEDREGILWEEREDNNVAKFSTNREWMDGEHVLIPQNPKTFSFPALRWPKPKPVWSDRLENDLTWKCQVYLAGSLNFCIWVMPEVHLHIDIKNIKTCLEHIGLIFYTPSFCAVSIRFGIRPA